MNIDWTELEQGFQQELEKAAISWPSIGKKAVPFIGTAGAAAAGVKGYEAVKDITKGVGGFMDSAKSLAPIGLAALFGGSGGGGAPQQQGVVNNYVNTNANRPSYLTPNPGTVSALSSPREYSQPNFKQADAIFDSLGDAVKRRIANSVINEVTKTNPLGLPSEEVRHKASVKSPQELEITSKYPEMQELLKDEQNKAYLQRLLQR